MGFKYDVTVVGGGGIARVWRVTFQTADAIDRNFRVGQILRNTNGVEQRVTAVVAV